MVIYIWEENKKQKSSIILWVLFGSIKEYILGYRWYMDSIIEISKLKMKL